jgi:hypothetical protein
MLGTRQMKASVAICKQQYAQWNLLDTLARLSVYTVPSSAPSYTALLPHFLPPRSSLLQTLIIIVLDWSRPWTFIEELQIWLTWVETWSKGDGSRELEVIREESRERRKFHMLHHSKMLTYHHNTFKFNLIYNIIRNQPTTLCLLQILRYQAHYYPLAQALLLIIQLVSQ